jgi:hypothetical protein
MTTSKRKPARADTKAKLLPTYKPGPIKMGRPSSYKPEFCKTIVTMGMSGAGKAEMAAAIGCSRETFIQWQLAHTEFSDAVKAAVYLSQAWWERGGRDGAFGKVPGFNQTAFIFTMKNMFGDDWRDKVEHSGSVDGVLHVTFLAADEKIM